MDRAEPGSRPHVLSDRAGLPLVVGASAGNCHDSDGLKPLVEALLAKHDPHRGRRIGVRIVRIGVDASQRRGRHRCAVERTVSWLTGYRRPAMPDAE